MDNPDNLSTLGTQEAKQRQIKQQQKHNTTFVGQHYT